MIAPCLRSIIIGPALPRDPNDPLVTVVPSLLKQVSNLPSAFPSQSSFRNLSCLHFDHDIAIPSYINDTHLLVHLACILYPQLEENALLKIGWDYSDYEDEEMAEKESSPVVGAGTIANLVPEAVDDGFPEVDAVNHEFEEVEEEVEILDSPPAIFNSRKKMKTVKVREQLDDRFLRRSRRLFSKTQGFKDASNASKAQ